MLRQPREILNPDIETQLNDLVEATNGLIDQVNASKSILDTKSEEAKGYSDSADTVLVEIDKAKVEVEKALEEALAAKDDTVSLSDNAAISLTAGAGKVPLADSEGFIDYKYIKPVRVPPADFSLPLRRDLYLEEGVATPVKIDVSQAQDGSTLATVPNLYQAEFTRNSEATYMDRGVLKIAGINEPRFETDINGNPLGILIEGESTNDIHHVENSFTIHEGSNYAVAEVKYSPMFNDFMGWEVFNVDDSGNEFLVRDLWVELYKDNETDFFTFSCVIKHSHEVKIGCSQHEGSESKTAFMVIQPDNTTSAINGSFTITDIKVKNLLGGYKRVSGLFTFLENVPKFGSINIRSKGPIHFGCFQSEKSKFLTSYIPTVDKKVTKQGDDLFFPASSMGYLGSKTIHYSLNCPLPDGLRGYVFGRNRHPQYFLFQYGYGGKGKVGFNVGMDKRIFGTTNVGETVSVTGTTMVSENILNHKLFIKGEQTSTFNQPLEQVDFNALLVNNFYFSGDRKWQCFGHIKDFKIWNRALTDEQIYYLGKD